MDKKEAYMLFLKLQNECTSHADCKGCPYSLKINGVELCAMANIHNIEVGRCLTAFLVKLGQNPSANFEELKNIVIHRPCAFKELPPELDEAPSPSMNAKHDNVNSPKHYCKGGLECIQVIKAELTPEQHKGYLYGNVLKYMWRWPDKNGLEDLRKAEHYLKWLIEEVKKNG